MLFHRAKTKSVKAIGTGCENFRLSYGMPLGDHHYISWLAKEVWMDQLLENAKRLLQQVLESTTGVNKVEIPVGSNLEAYFSDVVSSRYRGVLFDAFQKEMSVGTSPTKHVDLKNASRRLVYRYVTIFSTYCCLLK